MKLLITGGCGFLGSNIARKAVESGHRLVVFDNLSREGSASNLQWLKAFGNFSFFHGDIRNFNDITTVFRDEKPDAVFHLAGQVAMTTSIENPRLDFETNALGSFNVLEAVRTLAPTCPIIYSSTNKVYGDLEHLQYTEEPSRYKADGFPNGSDESTPIDLRSPYGCSKGSADQFMLDYSRVYGLNTMVFRHSSIFGGRQFSTFNQGWIGWFVQKALLNETFTISGDGKQVRDVLFADDLVALYFKGLEALPKHKGQAFNIGGGMDNSLSLLELFESLEKKLSKKLTYTRLPWRKSDQKVFVADLNKAKNLLNWTPNISKDEGLNRMISWVTETL